MGGRVQWLVGMALWSVTKCILTVVVCFISNNITLKLFLRQLFLLLVLLSSNLSILIAESALQVLRPAQWLHFEACAGPPSQWEALPLHQIFDDHDASVGIDEPVVACGGQPGVSEGSHSPCAAPQAVSGLGLALAAASPADQKC